MSVKVTFEFETAADAAAFLQDFDAPQASTEAGEAKRGRGRPRKEAAPAAAAPAQAAAAPAASAAQSAVQGAASPAQTAAAPAASVEQVTKAIADLADSSADNYNKAKGILAKYGAAHMRELKPEFYGSVVAECKAAMATPTSAASLI